MHVTYAKPYQTAKNDLICSSPGQPSVSATLRIAAYMMRIPMLEDSLTRL